MPPMLPVPVDVHYPDTDGKPMAENTLQYLWIVMLKEGLEWLFRGRDDVFIAADLFWYPIEGDPGTRTAPDVMVAFGRPPGHRSSYLQWREDGVAPQVVMEVLSPGNEAREMEAKRGQYAYFGVQEYYVIDPDHAALEVWLRRANTLARQEPGPRWDSPLLGISFERGEGLVVRHPDGEPFRPPLEQRLIERERAEVERQRAEVERQRAEVERQRADLAERELARLREEFARRGAPPP